MARIKSPTQVFRADGKGCFVEVLCNALPIDKVAINFVSYDTTKTKGSRETGHVTIYMNVFEAKVFAGDILSGRMSALADKARKAAADAGKSYPDKVYQLLGGTSGHNTPDHKPISRQFNLSPGASKPWVLDAMSGPGKIIGNGLIAPDGRPTTQVRIGLDNEMLKQMAYAIDMCCTLWGQAKFLPVLDPLMAEVRAQMQAAMNELSSKNNSPASFPEPVDDDGPDELPY